MPGMLRLRRLSLRSWMRSNRQSNLPEPPIAVPITHVPSLRMVMSQPAIEVRELCKFFGPVAAVDRVSFAVQPGELVGFLGPNGAGKSTVMRILTPYLPASQGTATIAGHDVMY